MTTRFTLAALFIGIGLTLTAGCASNTGAAGADKPVVQGQAAAQQRAADMQKQFQKMHGGTH